MLHPRRRQGGRPPAPELRRRLAERSGTPTDAGFLQNRLPGRSAWRRLSAHDSFPQKQQEVAEMVEEVVGLVEGVVEVLREVVEMVEVVDGLEEEVD